MIVACVKWGTRYGDEWVLRLRAMVARNLTIQHRFVCLTDKPIDGVECVPLVSNLTGWWAKLELFRNFTGPVLYLDLDVVVTRSIDVIVEVANSDPTRLWMRDDFSYSLRNPKPLDAAQRRFLGGHGTCNSSVMAWHAEAMRDVWDSLDERAMAEVHGDQNYLSQKLWPDRIGLIPDAYIESYKYGRLHGRPTAPVMVFHGKPKMDELDRSSELRRIWEEAA